MTREELAKQIAKLEGFDQAKARRLIDAFCDSVKEALQRNDRVVYSNFGSFYKTHYPAKMISLTVKGEKRQIPMPATDSMKWMPSSSVKDMVELGRQIENATAWGTTNAFRKTKRPEEIEAFSVREVGGEITAKIIENEIAEIPIRIIREGIEINAVAAPEITEEIPIEITNNFQAPELIPFAPPPLSGIEFIDLSATEIPPFYLDLIPLKIARENGLLATGESGDSMVVAMADPADLEIISYLKRILRKNILPRLAAREEIDKILAGHESNITFENNAPLPEIKTPSRRILHLMLKRALRSHASAIHLEPAENEALIRFRVDEKFSTKSACSLAVYQALASDLKNLFEGKEINGVHHLLWYNLDNQPVGLTVSFLPVAWGEKIVLKILGSDNTQIPPLKKIRFNTADLNLLQNYLSSKCGIIVVSGPYGGGKTTLLYSIATELSKKYSVTTIENTIERRIVGVSQCQIDDHDGWTVQRFLELAIEQESDVILLSEMPTDSLTLRTLAKAAARSLILLGFESEKINLSNLTKSGLLEELRLIVNCRTIRRLCHCRHKISLAPAEGIAMLKDLRVLFHSDEILKNRVMNFYEKTGCVECDQTGFNGRLALYELFEIDNNNRAALSSRTAEIKLRQDLAKAGRNNIIENGVLEIFEGATCVDEVEKTLK